jgi:hypothetical protein
MNTEINHCPIWTSWIQGYQKNTVFRESKLIGFVFFFLLLLKEKGMEKEWDTRWSYTAVLEKIVALRTKKRITQIKLADHLKLGEGGYFKVEKGIRKLDLERLFEILKFLEVSPEEFFKDIK